MARKFNPYSLLVRWWFTAKMAMHGIVGNPLRSGLTILGVAIGVTSVVSLMGIGEGARQAVVRQFESLGTNVIAVKVSKDSAEFEPEFAQELVERVDGLEMATPVTHVEGNMRWRRSRGKAQLLGVNHDFPIIRDHDLVSGRFFTSLHVAQRSNVAVLGYNVAQGLLYGRDVVGQKISLEGESYTIVGILEPKGAGNGEEIDDKILIPYTSALKIAKKRTVEEIWGKAYSTDDADLAVVQMSRIIKRKLGIDEDAPVRGINNSEGEEGRTQEGTTVVNGNGTESVAVAGKEMADSESVSKPTLPGSGEDLVTITNLNQLVKEADNANRVMTLLLGGIAAVSLLVGGLGIMNIMMVAVSERTEEIGVRRALGAKQGDLLLQFILEALYVSIIGSIVGIATGIWGLGIFDQYGFETAVSFKAIRIATVVALASGLLFGVYPAVSASSVPPVEALRRQ